MTREAGTRVFGDGLRETPAPSSDPGLAEPAASIELELKREQRAWRERALRGITWSLCAVCSVAALWFALVTTPLQFMVPCLAVCALGLAGAQYARRLAIEARAAFVLGAVCVPCVYALVRGGYTPNALVGLAMLVVGTTLLLGRRAGLALAGAAALVIAGVSLLHRSYPTLRGPGWIAILDSTNPLVGARVALLFALLTATIVIAISYLATQSDELFAAKARSLVKLEQEQLEKERMARDLERREAAFQKARELELLGRLAGTMAHDFNNALLVVLSALDELAQLEGLPNAAQSPLAAIRAAADQAAATTRQLRAFGPLEPRHASELALGPLVEKAKTMFSRVLPRNIRLDAEIGCDACIVADEGELLRVLMNLALNARDAMRDGGVLTLRVRRPRAGENTGSGADSVVLEVEDTGSGMSDEVKARLFEPFFTTKAAAGTGLGLASVREIVESQGARVRVTTAVGRGTTFSLVWPLAVPSSAPVPTPTPVPSSRSAVVLLVDDDAAVRLALGRGLERLGFSVVSAADGEAGLLAARRYASNIDVLCTDCLLPGLPVRDLIARFRDLHQGHVIVCSGYAPTETGLSPSVFDDFVPKPFSIHELAKRINALVP